jgi:hypothetical protein
LLREGLIEGRNKIFFMLTELLNNTDAETSSA